MRSTESALKVHYLACVKAALLSIPFLHVMRWRNVFTTWCQLYDVAEPFWRGVHFVWPSSCIQLLGHSLEKKKRECRRWPFLAC